MMWQECFAMGWPRGEGVSSSSGLVHSYTLDLMSRRNVNQRFNKQNPVRTDVYEIIASPPPPPSS